MGVNLKILTVLDRDSRVTTKQLGKIIRKSQQASNYLLHKFEDEDYFLNYIAIIDPAKFGLIKIIVFYNFINFKNKDKILRNLLARDMVLKVEECSQGFDLLVEFAALNLSSFNKENREILHLFRNDLKQMSIYPVIVMHKFGRSFDNFFTPKDIIISGDREIESINIQEKMFLKLIQLRARESIVSLASKLKTNTKKIISIKKKLENKKIIRKYSVSVNSPDLGIIRAHILLNLNLDGVAEISKFIEFLKSKREIFEVQKIVGDFELLITIEVLESINQVLREIRQDFLVSDFKIIYSERIILEKSIPDLVLN